MILLLWCLPASFCFQVTPAVNPSLPFSVIFSQINDSAAIGDKAASYQRNPGECILIYPYWYRANDTGSLECVGKTSFKYNVDFPLHPSDNDLKADIETLLDIPLEPDLLPMEIDLRSMVVFTVNSQEPTGMFHTGDYVHLAGFLYRVDKAGCLQVVGENKAVTYNDMLQGFQKLTGHTIKKVGLSGRGCKKFV